MLSVGVARFTFYLEMNLKNVDLVSCIIFSHMSNV